MKINYIFKYKKVYSIVTMVIGIIFLIYIVFLVINKQQQYISIESLRKSNNLAKSWLFNNLQDGGLFLYLYNPKTGESSEKNNAIRQLMASRVLAQESIGDTKLLKLHQKNLDFVLSSWYKEDKNGGYIFYNSKSKLGANAMMLRVLIDSPFFEKYKDKAGKLAKGILFLQKRSGAFTPWYIKPNYIYNEDYLLTFYSGEALLSLVEYYEKTGDKKYLNASLLSADFYINRYVKDMDKNYYPAYIPWYTLALGKLYKITNDEKYVRVVFALNDKLLEIQDVFFYAGRFYNPKTPQYGTPHSSSDAVYTEGLAYAYEIALDVNDKKHEKRYYKALKIAVSNLISLQYKDVLKGANKSDSVKYIGAISINVSNPWIRVDTTQHTIDAFTKIEDLMGTD